MQIRKVFKDYDDKKTGKINLEQFLLSLINGYLKKSFTDPMVMDTFINLDLKKAKEE